MIVLGSWFDIVGVASAHVIAQVISLGFLFFINRKLKREKIE